MANDKPAKPAADALAKELKSSLAKERPRTWKPVLAIVVLCSVTLALLTWWLMPRARPPVLQVVAFDGVFTPDETPMARGQFFTGVGDDSAPRLSGRKMAFDDQNNRNIIQLSDANGQAAADWSGDDEPVMAFFVRFVDPERRQGSAKEAGRLFVWPKDSRLLFVDADETLTDPAGDASATTLKQADDDGWRIVYLALAADRAHEFRQARSRIDNLVKLPKGPIVGRNRYPATDSLEAARREAVQALKGKFKGPGTAIVQNADTAAACKAMGLRVIRIGDAATPTWAEVKLD